MLSDSIREARRQALSGAHGGVVMSGDDMIALAAKLAAWETAAANLEETVRLSRQDIRAQWHMLGVRRTFGRRMGGAR